MNFFFFFYQWSHPPSSIGLPIRNKFTNISFRTSKEFNHTLEKYPKKLIRLLTQISKN